MAGLQIIGLGMATVDILVRTHQMPTFERGAHLDALAVEGGGPVATALAAAARLGARVGFVGTRGCDRLSEIKMQTLAEFGIDASRVVLRQAPEDQVVLVCVNAGSGERIFSGLGMGHNGQLLPEELDQRYLTAADFLHLDGFHGQAALQAARWMRAAGKQVMLDGSATNGPISEGMRALVREVDVLICGSGFGPALTGESDLWQAGQAVLAMGPQIVVQTEGSQGSYTVTRTERFHTPAFEGSVVDTTGAGDVFHGAYLVGLLRGWNAYDCALFSTAVSALKCTQLSGRSGIPTFAAARTFLQARGFHLPA